ncbi:outer membrane protein [Legionella geestiana]|uniref:Outer membrane protein n=1 Tax=Legionella geestiana TaxID=45065 RepID=A0A0W0U9K6_9GAMM|nr:Lpg1974 family pore-forming outer membrane protein [Legionella geestiana]KTD04479.1 outer membrane protein [Legionella geestiana]QBS12249.1 hypothetical protein E4T54_05535 [Legionella geestiana]STX53017.1 major outer membrane protein [Legionella geestiana]
MLKKTVLAVSGILASAVAAAGTMGPVCTPGSVTVPCAASGWDVGIQALYLKPMHTIAENPITVVDSDPSLGMDWGFRLEGSYHFNTGNDITMTWIHYDQDSTLTGQGLDFALPFAPIDSKVNNRIEQVNLVMGQHVDMGARKDARFYAGMQYAKLVLDTNTFYGVFPIAGPVAFNGLHTSYFQGVGPVVGVDYAYDVMGGLSLTANTAATVLYGNSRSSASVVLNEALITQSFYAQKKAIVPELEAKLGLNYAHAMAYGTLNLEGGYMAMNYFNPLMTYFHTNSDVGYMGPYFGVKWLGAA